MPITEQQLAARLRDARDAAGLTQEQVAAKLGISRSAVAQIEGGNRSVSSLELDRLARSYGRSLDELLADTFDAEATLVAIFRSEASAVEGDTLLNTASHAIEIAREMANLEEILDMAPAELRAPSYEVRPARSKWDAVAQGARAAAEERKRLDLGDRPLGDVADLLEGQGVRTALLPLPDDISGLTLMDPRLSFFVVANEDHAVLRRRFSWIHEYAHILFDRDQRGTVSRVSDRADLAEVRANSFAACFLLPEEGVRRFLQALGKGRGSRDRWQVDDGNEGGEVEWAEGRPEPGSQEIQTYDVIRLARRFGVSRTAALYRLKNLKLISQEELDAFMEQEQRGEALAIERSLGLPGWNGRTEPDTAGVEAPFDPEPADFQGRFLSLALEAFRRHRISRGKLHQLARLIDRSPDAIDSLLDQLGFLEDDPEDSDDVLLPEV